MPATASRYAVWDDEAIRRGDARDVLEQVRAGLAQSNDEVRKMSVDDYAKAIIEDAPYFIEASLLRALEEHPFQTVYDKALTYLASSPSSRVRIISRD